MLTVVQTVFPTDSNDTLEKANAELCHIVQGLIQQHQRNSLFMMSDMSIELINL